MVGLEPVLVSVLVRVRVLVWESVSESVWGSW